MSGSVWKELEMEGIPMSEYYREGRLWVLGNNDGEMEVIKRLLKIAGETFIQPKWQKVDPPEFALVDTGLPLASFSHIADGREYCTNKDIEVFIFVECTEVRTWEFGGQGYLHIMHGDEGEPAAIFQVLKFLEKKGLRISWTTLRWVEIVAAYDHERVVGLDSLGATEEECRKVSALHGRAITKHVAPAQ